MRGGYRRSGFGRRVVVAIGVAVVLFKGMFLARARAQDAAGLWPLLYLPVLLGAIYVGALLARLSRARRPRGAVA